MRVIFKKDINRHIQTCTKVKPKDKNKKINEMWRRREQIEEIRLLESNSFSNGLFKRKIEI